MSYKIIRSVSFQDKEVLLDFARSDVVPHTFNTRKDPHLTNLYRKRDGKRAVLISLSEDLFSKRIVLRPHNCHLLENMQYARTLIKEPLSFFLDAGHAGKFIADVVSGIERETMFSPVEDLKKLEALRSDPEAVLAISKNNPQAFVFSADNVRRDRDAAKHYIKQCVGDPHFSFPSYFADDRELARMALKVNGRVFQQLDKTLRNDKELALLAYSSVIPRQCFATDPSYLGADLLSDKKFLRELCCICPDLQAERTAFILKYPEVAEAWVLNNNGAYSQTELLSNNMLKNHKIRSALISGSAADPDRCILVSLLLSQADKEADVSTKAPADSLLKNAGSQVKKQPANKTK